MHQVFRHTFAANEDNAGGRLQIKNSIQRHQQAILQAQTDLGKIKQFKTIYPVYSPYKPKEIPAKAKKKFPRSNYRILSKTTLKQQDEFRMIYNTLKSVTTLKKGLVDHSLPGTFKLKEKLLNKPKWQNEQKFIEEEHDANIYNQFSRVKSAKDLPQDVRKKNQQDPIAYPTYHFAKPGKKDLYDKNGVHFSDLHKQHKSTNKQPKLKPN